MHEAHWYAVASKPRQEQEAQRQLERQGYTTCLPLMTVKKRRQGKWQQLIEPVFPGYLFVALAMGIDDIAPIRSTIGVQGLVRFGAQYTPVPRDVMAALQAMSVDSLSTADTEHALPFKKGDAVVFEAGPFAGLTAVFDMRKGDDRVRVLLDILGKTQQLLVDPNQLSVKA